MDIYRYIITLCTLELNTLSFMGEADDLYSKIIYFLFPF